MWKAHGVRSTVDTKGRFSFLAADTLRKQHNTRKNVIPKAQHRFCTMV